MIETIDKDYHKDDLRAMSARISELERQLADAVNGKLPEDVRLDADLVSFASLVSSETGEPRVMMRWFTHVAQLTPESARRMAIDLMRVADAAESDAFLLDFLRNKIGATDEQIIGGVIWDFRQYREKREMEEKGK